MCIIILGDIQPTTTQLMNIPVNITGEQDAYNFFIYVNNFDVSNNSSIMVVPFPVDKNIGFKNIGLVDISTDPMKQLRKNIKDVSKQLVKRSSISLSSRMSIPNSAPLQVHKIGNYNISVAFSIEELLNRIDWEKFKKPANFSKRMDTFNNKDLYPETYDYFYVVAEAVESITDDGFGIVYPQLNDYFYMPTAHEDTASHHDFDVALYNFNYEKNSYGWKFDGKLDALNNHPVKMLDDTFKEMVYDTKISSFNFERKSGLLRNHNVWLKK